MIPVRIVAANKYSSPWFATKLVMSKAIEPVAAEIIAGRPPAREITVAIQKDVYSATIGLTLTIAAKARDSGMSASATVIPANTSAWAVEKNEFLIVFNFQG